MKEKPEASGVGWLWPACKIVVALALLSYGILLTVPRMVEISSVDAVITARLVTVRAPVAGSVMEGASAPGTWLEKGAPLARIESRHADSRLLKDVQDELDQQSQRLLALEGHSQKLGEAGKKLEAEGNTAKKAEILVAQATLEAMIVDVRRRQEILRATARRESERAGQKELTVVAAPVSGLVWRAHETAGAQTAVHEPLVQMLDAGTIFVDASIHKNDLSYLKLGGPVSVKPVGQDTQLEGTIQTLLAPSAFGEREDFAGGGPALHGDEYRVLIRLELTPKQRPLVAALMAGTRATVRFGRRTNVLDALFTLSR